MASIAISKGGQTRGRAPSRLGAAARHALTVLAGAVVVMLALTLALALASHDPGDPSLNTATGRAPSNWLGVPGAGVSDTLLALLGAGAAVLLPAVAAFGVRVARAQPLRPWPRMMLATLAAALLAAVTAGLVAPGEAPGGAVGVLAARGLGQAAAAWFPATDPLTLTLPTAVLALVAAVLLWAWGLGIDAADWARLRRVRLPSPPERRPREAAVAVSPRRAATGPDPEPRLAAAAVAAAPRARVSRPEPPPARAKPPVQSALALGDRATLPPLSLLRPPAKSAGGQIDGAALEQNARLLESVLDDYGVKGEIAVVKPGPVVTLYELEPAAGIKASRVIGLSDDIARSMSAVSARVAVVPGRNVIGIELPNHRREMVVLSELIASAAFEAGGPALPIVLGKDISGEPVIADLAPMPHLLIAGTTGSGKSVGLNAMILSLLYRLTPAECRLIMIDPKMLELSVYDNIPHLLSPVVTEPPKAIRALKWAVEEMETRYRKMANLNVRSVSGFNQKINEARAKGKPFVRSVQTGWDDDGRPVTEDETLDYEPLYLIVVVVDELADLMMTAGKEVEFLIQRLAQKARAAGIHLIMATQRPSVDVITGVIKANLPTRISFQVTSKIDSRTILGEQGAEQLLGKGDMLYMPGGKQVVRVHGPFVSDEEVEAVAAHWKRQGRPDYVQAVTEEPDEEPVFGTDAGSFGGTAGDDEADLYRKAVQVVAESQKASTSYLQRQLRVGYNNAARLIEKMEKQGVVSTPDHVGRREVLIDAEGNRV